MKVRGAGTRIALVVGTVEIVLPVLKAGGGAVVELRAAIGAVHQPGKRTLFPRLGGAALVLP